jgi:hypothetical protein
VSQKKFEIDFVQQNWLQMLVAKSLAKSTDKGGAHGPGNRPLFGQICFTWRIGDSWRGLIFQFLENCEVDVVPHGRVGALVEHHFKNGNIGHSGPAFRCFPGRGPFRQSVRCPFNRDWRNWRTGGKKDLQANWRRQLPASFRQL